MKEPYATKINPELKKAIKRLSDEAKVPQARLIEEAIELLIKHYERKKVK